MKSLEIKNYKNLKDFKIDSLSRVNLIVGRNNVGKSTLLEAISIFAAGGNISCLRDILEIRGETRKYSSEDAIEKEIEGYASLYSDGNTNNFYNESIQIVSDLFTQDLHTVGLKLLKFVDIKEIDQDGIQKFTRKFLENTSESDITDSNAPTGIMASNGEKRAFYTIDERKRVSGTDKNIPYEYVRTSQISSSKNPALFDKIALSPLEKEIIKALQIIEPRIEAINFLNDESNYRNLLREDNRVPFVVFPMNTRRYRLTSMGDGLNRILTIILALLNCKEGILLIDEFENGLHYSVQTQLWQIIYKLAEELNIQVFATTHSEDCIKSFVTADSAQAGKIIRLENRDGNIVPVLFNDSERLQFAIDQNIEIR